MWLTFITARLWLSKFVIEVTFFLVQNTLLGWFRGLYLSILVPRGRVPFGQHQESRPLGRSNFLRRVIVSYSQPIRFAILDSEHAQSDGKSVNCGLPVLDLPRGWSQRSRFSVLTKRSAASEDENDLLRTLRTFLCGGTNITCKTQAF